MKHTFFIALLWICIGGCSGPEVIPPDPYVPWEGTYWVELTFNSQAGKKFSDNFLFLSQKHPDTLIVNGVSYPRPPGTGDRYSIPIGWGIKSITVTRDADSLVYFEEQSYSSQYGKGRKITTALSFADVNNELAIGLPDTIWVDTLTTYQNLSTGNFTRFTWIFPYNPAGYEQGLFTTGTASLQLSLSAGNLYPSNPYYQEDYYPFVITLRAYRPDGSRTDRTFPVRAYRKR